MKLSIVHIKFKIALHSFGWVLICLVLFLLSLYFNIIKLEYLLAGLLIGSTFRVFLNRKKYLLSTKDDIDRLHIEYLTSLLFKKKLSITKTNLDITDITETNWWYGDLDKLILDNKIQRVVLSSIDKKLKKTAKALLE